MQQTQQLSQFLGQPSISGQEALFYCPFCKHKKKKLSVNTESLCWHCWVCQEKGANLAGLLWKSGHKQASKLFKHAKRQIVEPVEFHLSLPEEYVFFDDLKDKQKTMVMQHLRQRNVTHEQILQHKIGYCQDGMYANRIILPSFNKFGQLNFFTARTLQPNRLKYLSPSTPKGYRHTIICNELNIDWQEDVFLVEGFFDMIHLSNSIPLQGNLLPERSTLFQALAKHAKAVYVCLDSDARKYQFKILKALAAYEVPCFDMCINPIKDPGMANETFLQRKKLDAKPITCDNILQIKMRELTNGLDA